MYYYLADSLSKVKRDAEALPYLEKLAQEFEKREFLPLAQKMIEEIKTDLGPAKPSGG